MTSALKALLLTAQLAGVAPGDLKAPKVASGPAAVQPVVQVPLKGVRAGMARAAAFRELDGVRLGFSLALGKDGYLWLRVRGGEDIANIPLPALRGMVDAELGGVWYRLRLSGDDIQMATHQGEAVSVSLQHLVASLYRLGVHLNLGPVVYTVLYENGNGIPEAAGLLRRDTEGMFWVTYNSAEVLTTIRYFVSINGTMFGMRLEKPFLAFYSKPTPVSFLGSFEKPAIPPK